MIDMHSHCLPAFDDGAKDIDEALLMLEDAYEKGIEIVYATPHCRVYSEEELETAVKSRDRVYDELMSVAAEKKNKIPILKKGFEVYLDKDITSFGNFRELCMEGTNAMLVEMPMEHWGSFALGRIKALKAAGIIPIIAHIDRYLEFKKNIEKALSLDGVIYQVNADAFFGFHRMRLIKKLLNLGKTVVVGSDMHNMKSRRSRLSEACKKAIKKNKSYEIMFNTDISAL